MKLRLLVITTVVAVFSLLAAAADTPKTTQASAAFDRLKSLAGDWESNAASGKKSHSHYEIISGGSAVIERFVDDSMGAANAMETVYYLDGDRLLLTHYCMAHNQPRMQAESFNPASGDLRFAFLDATGLSNADVGHMHNVSFRFVDANHFTADWQFFEGGKAKFTESAQYTRVR